MSYQSRVLSTPTVFNAEDNGVWTLADLYNHGHADLVYIKTRNTGTGKIEVHGALFENLYQQHTVHTGTCFGIEDNGVWLMQDYTGDGRADLVYIKTRNTGTGKIEVHVADAASNYQNFVLHTGTCFGCEENGIWTMSSKADLVYIKTRNTGSNMIEIHVANKSSNYQTFTQHIATSFNVEDNGVWCLAPKCDGDFADLYYIKTRNTGTNKVEVHAVSASSGWKTRIIATGSFFNPQEQGQWLMANVTHQSRPDLAYLKVRDTRSGKIEVNVVAPEIYVKDDYTKSSRNVSLSGTVLSAELRRNDGSWHAASIDLNNFIGNIDGWFTWDKVAFAKTARNIRLDGPLLRALLEDTDQQWNDTDTDLRERVINNNGVFELTKIPAVFALTPDAQARFLSEIGKALEQPGTSVKHTQDEKGAELWYVDGHADWKDTMFATYTAEARASMMHVVQTKGKPIEQVNVDVFSAGVGASFGAYTGVEANVSLFKAEASIFDLNLGVGVDTGFGIKDGSLDVEVAGCGVQIGRKVSISAFGSSFGIDFGRLYDSFF